MEIPIASIKVGKRFRQELGDVAGLARSIEKLTLLQSIVVSADYDLVDGQRRLVACKELGLEMIPVRIVNLDAAGALLAERDANEQHKPFTVSESIAIGRAIEEREKPKAEERKKAAGGNHGNQHTGGKPGKKTGGSDDSSEPPPPPVRDIAAAAVGMAPATYAKAKEVIEAAESDPEAFGDLVEQMDRTGKVEPAHRETQRRRQVAPTQTTSKPLRKYDVEKDIIRIRELVRKLYDNWTHEEDKVVIRQLFKQLANEV